MQLGTSGRNATIYSETALKRCTATRPSRQEREDPGLPARRGPAAQYPLAEPPERSRCSPLRRRWSARAAFALSLLCAAAAGAQDVTEPSLKAAFIYNFAKFTEWPPDVLPATAPFTACVLGDAPDRRRARANRQGAPALGPQHQRVARALDGPLRSCHLLYHLRASRRRKSPPS